MPPRRWDVVGRRPRSPRERCLVACRFAVIAALLAAGCGDVRYSAAPEPRFTRGEPPPAAPTTRVPPVTAEEPDLDDIEPDNAVPGPDDAGRVESMVIRDDAGNRVPNASGWADFDAALAARLVPANASAAIAVMIDGVVVHEAAYGVRVAGTFDAVEVGDRFRIGSISKTITAIVTLQLVEAGLLTLDEPVGQVLIDHLGLPAADPDVAGITVRELLSHTAGFGKHQATFFGGRAASYTDAVRIGLSSGVGSGGGYSYSNMSYATLTVLIEAVTGQTYERVVRERLLEPLGLDAMRMSGTHELGPDEVSHHPVAGRNYMETLGGAGAWNATPTDVVQIINAIDPATGGWKALSPETLSAMRYRLPTGAAPAGYGLGLINYSADAWGHTGTIEHAHAMVLVHPDGLTWAVTVSGDSPSNTEALRGIVGRALAEAFPGG